HANAGCIVVSGVNVCAPGSVSITTGYTVIYARFNSGDTTDQYVIPGCQLDASWPSYYGDIYFGDDNCLYDGNGQNINGQCCNVGSGGTQEVPNPYYKG
ncbi:hypothetical protein H0H92_005845, partial [Tricholoma furcatifolium]